MIDSSAHKVAFVGLVLTLIMGLLLAVSLFGRDREGVALTAQSGNKAIIDADSTMTATIDNLLSLPLYQGAYAIEGDSLNSNPEQTLHMQAHFRVPATNIDVFKYYSDILLAKGWIEDGRNIWGGQPGQHRDFLWTDNTKITPFALTLSVSVRTIDSSDPRVDIFWDKWPDISNIPMYPGAANVQVVESVDARPSDSIITTTYTIDAETPSLIDYYNTVMKSLRFLPDTPSPPSDYTARFVFVGGWTPENRWADTVTITISPRGKKLLM